MIFVTLFGISFFGSASALREAAAHLGLAVRTGLKSATHAYKQIMPSTYQAIAYLPESKRSKTAVWILKEKYNKRTFDPLSLRDLDTLICFVPREGAKIQLIEDRKGTSFTSLTVDQVKNLFTQASKFKAAKAVDILQNNSDLSLHDRLSLLSYLSEKDAEIWAIKFIKDYLEKEEVHHRGDYFKLFDYLSDKTQQSLAYECLENTENPMNILSNFPVATRAAWIREKLTLYFKKLHLNDVYSLVKYLPRHEQEYWILRIFNERDHSDIASIRPGCGVSPINALLESLSPGQIKSFRIKTYKPLTSILEDKKYVNSGPLFSRYHRRFFEKLFIARSSQPLNEMFAVMAEYMYQQYKKGQVVFVHGHGAEWCLLEKFYNLFLSVSSKTSLKADIVRLRFTTKTINPEEEALIREKGVTWSLYSKYRRALLFVNIHPFANKDGSNSLEYAASNFDQTVKDLDKEDGTKKFNRFSDTPAQKDEEENFLLTTIKIIARDLGCEQYFHDHKNQIVECIDLYFKANKASGNHGQMVVIAMPQEVAKKLAYPTKSGGAVQELRIRPWKTTTDVVEIVNNYNFIPFNNEYALILGPTLLKNPQEAGIEIKRFSPMLQFKNLFYLTFEKKLKELADK